MIKKIKVKVLFFYFFALMLLAIIFISVVYLSWNLVLLTLGVGGGSLTLGALLPYLFTTIPHFQKIWSYVARGFSYFRFAELASVKYNIEGNLNTSKETINSEVRDLMPCEAKVKWVQEVDSESFLDEYKGKVIIKMHPHSNQAANLTHATMAYVSKGLIPESRLYLDEKMGKSVDLTMVKKILSETNQKSALGFFLREVISKEINDSEIRDHIAIMETWDKRGIFTRMFLNELRELGRKLFPNIDKIAHADIKGFYDYLDNLTKREPGEETELSYLSKRIRVHTLLVAKETTFIFRGTTPYIESVKKALANGINSEYILARGSNILIARKVMEEIASIPGVEKVEGTDKEFIVSLDGRPITKICTQFMLKPQLAVPSKV